MALTDLSDTQLEQQQKVSKNRQTAEAEAASLRKLWARLSLEVGNRPLLTDLRNTHILWSAKSNYETRGHRSMTTRHKGHAFFPPQL